MKNDFNKILILGAFLVYFVIDTAFVIPNVLNWIIKGSIIVGALIFVLMNKESFNINFKNKKLP